MLELLTAAIDAAREHAQDAPPQAKLAGYYVKRGQARLAQGERDCTAVIQDATEALQRQPDLHGAHGLAADAYLRWSRQQNTRKDRIDCLDKSIKAGDKAVQQCPADDKSLPNYYVCLSSAYVERANFEKDADRQRQFLDVAVQCADAVNAKAKEKSVARPDYPYLTLGNAYEDLAWLAEREPKENYQRAVAAFTEAKKQAGLSAKAPCGIGRCYYKAVAMTYLEPPVLEKNSKAELIEQCKNELTEATMRDAKCVEAYLYLGRASQYEEKYADADQFFDKAKSIAQENGDSDRAIYLSEWARFPLYNKSLPAEQRHQLAIDRAKQLKSQDLPPPPGASLDPLNEEAWIRAMVHFDKGGEAYKRANEQVAKAQSEQARTEIEQGKREYEQAKEICDQALSKKDLTQPGLADVGLLLLRAQCNLQFAAAQQDRATARGAAQAAIDDALRAAGADIFRDTIAAAYGCEAQARYLLSSQIEGQAQAEAALDEAIQSIDKAMQLAPRRPGTAGWLELGVDCFLSKYKAKADVPGKLEVLSKAIEWHQRCLQSANPAALGQQNRNLDGLLMLGVQYADILVPEVTNQQQRAILERAMGWHNERARLRQVPNEDLKKELKALQAKLAKP